MLIPQKLLNCRQISRTHRKRSQRCRKSEPKVINLWLSTFDLQSDIFKNPHKHKSQGIDGLWRHGRTYCVLTVYHTRWSITLETLWKCLALEALMKQKKDLRPRANAVNAAGQHFLYFRCKSERSEIRQSDDHDGFSQWENSTSRRHDKRQVRWMLS